jgi:hypothetical protein
MTGVQSINDCSNSKDGPESGTQDSIVPLGRRLTEIPVFNNCGQEFLDAIAEQARYKSLKEDEEMELKDGGSLCIVENGALKFCIGAGPAVIVGPGTALNCSGFLGVLGEAEAYKPRRDEVERSKSKDRSLSKEGGADTIPAYNLTTNTSAPPPTLFVNSKQMTSTQGKKVPKLSMDEVCFYNLCPYAAHVGAPSRRPSGWMSFKITGAVAGAVPQHGDACHTSKTAEFGGARHANSMDLSKGGHK